MKKAAASLLLTFSLLTGATAQAQQPQASSPYRTRFVVDAPITLGLAGANVLGLYLIQQKTGLTKEEVAALSKNNVPKFDRFVAGKYSESARTKSDYLFYGSLVATPTFLALLPATRHRYGQVAGLYVQTVATTGALFTMAAGNVYRSRPLTYSNEASTRQRTRKNATNSFFAGHTATTATATFFAAKVFNDFHPDSPARPYVWGAAAAIPAAVGYYRLQAGKHFLSDNLLGYAVGATAGILVPHLHKAGQGRLSLEPIQGINSNGYAYSGLLLTKRL
ncbi:phosphatase PAP2 family protein [Hymenobacter weizhouensis]|uniref:phosphatase PAP2 family protein n=1 Tax=Hymenobacter sp. YIM 151500-1 TaxID=2987689 RepID=UPI0022277500|nr:phosphatase PAP2 family protein [Hymenobacter sp. YIM 151500-1]UYZ62804.1 phosphatase PAP2 family protein [Hymenobacter sp. YIM 151500-1]